MIRFIIKRHTVDLNEGSNNEDYYTIDADVPELEACLRRGGSGEMGFERHRLIGCEVIELTHSTEVELLPRDDQKASEK